MSASDFVTLRGGPTLPLEAVLLALTLEARGFVVKVSAEELFIAPRELLTDADRTEIRRWRNHLKAIVAYCPESVQ